MNSSDFCILLLYHTTAIGRAPVWQVGMLFSYYYCYFEPLLDKFKVSLWNSPKSSALCVCWSYQLTAGNLESKETYSESAGRAQPCRSQTQEAVLRANSSLMCTLLMPQALSLFPFPSLCFQWMLFFESVFYLEEWEEPLCQ